MKRYYFEDITRCEMCGDDTSTHKILGQRLNQSQGLSPKRKTGISVSVKKCSKCDLIYASPLPVPFDIQDHYGVPPEDYWIPQYFEWTPEVFAKEIKQAKALLQFKEDMTALDIGAGIGKNMISLERAGFDTYGMEPSQPFYERAISKMNIDPNRIKLGMIEDMKYEEASFDFISFGAVFEHLYHPAAILLQAAKWLKPNGIIHIEVPSSGYLVSKLFNLFFKLRGTNYVTNISPMHSPFHIYEFGLQSFHELCGRAGLKVELYEYMPGTNPSIPRAIQPPLRKYMKWTNTGLQLILYLRKI